MIDEHLDSLEIVKYTKILPKAKDIIYAIKDFDVEYSDEGNSTYIIGKMSVKRFLNRPHEEKDQLYVFHNMLQDDHMFQIITCLIPPPQTDKTLRISRLYIGNKGSGTHVHNHSIAVNYLLKGRKLWFTFPPTEHNTQMLDNIIAKYGNITKTSVLDWLNINYDYLSQNMTNFQTMIQEDGECILVPAEYYHGVVNLENVIGVTYSWY